MKKIIKKLIPSQKKKTFTVLELRENRVFSETQLQRKLTENQWKHFSAAIVMRKTIDVIA